MALSQEQNQQIKSLSNAWNSAKTKEEKDKIHQQANNIRISSGMVPGQDFNATTGASLISNTAMPNVASTTASKPAPSKSNSIYANQTFDTIKGMKPQDLEVYNPEFKEGNKVDLSGLYNAIGSKPGQEFSLGDLRGSMDKQQQAGGNIQVDPARFQNTEQISQLINQMNQVLAPLTQAQQGAAVTGYNSAMQNLDNKWAARGLAASGGAAAQQRQGANALSSQLAGIEAQQQANAIPMAFDFGQMGLQESAQRFNQQDSNRNFEQNKSQQGVANMLAALGMQEEQIQNYINNLSNATQMDMGQNQWAQEFGLQQQANDFGRWFDTNQLNSQNRNSFMDALLGAGNLGEDARQFDANFGEGQRQFDMKFGEDQRQFDTGMRENQRQFNVGAANDLSRIFGTGVQPKMSGQELFNQVQGMPTLDAQNANMDALLKAMGMTPYIPQGAGNVAGNNPAFAGMDSFLNSLGGQATQDTFNQSQLNFRANSGGGSGSGGSPKNYKSSFNDWVQYFREQFKNDVDSNQNQGAVRIEQDMFNNQEFIDSLIENGYDVQAVMDALYYAYSGGRFKTKQDYLDYVEDLKENQPANLNNIVK